MKRRDFNRLALSAGLSSIVTKPTLAQMSAEELKSRSPAAARNIVIKNSPRTYNQVNVPRKYLADQRRFSYWTWSYPWEANRDVSELDDRLSRMTEVHRVGWPDYEKPEWSERAFLQGIAGTLGGRFGPIFPKTPTNYGFTIIAKIKQVEKKRSANMEDDREGYCGRLVSSRPAQASLPATGSV
jgi:hypothetical protein